jgi:hypothetical protein
VLVRGWEPVGVGSYPIVTPQYSATTLNRVSYHIRSLYFGSHSRIPPQVGVDPAAAVADFCSGYLPTWS